MISISHWRLGLTALALTLVLSLPAFAQNGTTGAPPSPPMNDQGGPGEGHGQWNNESFDRQGFREEMEQIRKEHEELEVESDKLMDRCVNVTAQQAEQCKAERQALHERKERLHERMKALHEKMEAERKEHEEKREEKREERHEQSGKGKPPAPAPGGTPPATN